MGVRRGMLTTVTLLLVAHCVGCGPAASGTPVPTPTPTAPLTPGSRLAATVVASPTPPAPSPTPSPTADHVALQVAGQIGGQSLAVAVAGSTAYLGVGPRLLVLDVSTPDAPQWLGQSAVLPGVVQDVAVAGGLAYVAAGDAGLRVLDVSNPAHPREMGSAPALAEVHIVFVRDRIAYVGDSACQGGDCIGDLRAIDVSTPNDPQAIGLLKMPDAVNSVGLVGSYAYVAHRQGLTVVDVSDPHQLRELVSFPLQGSAESIAIAGAHAFVVSGPYVLLLDASSPTAPREIGSSSIIFAPKAVTAEGDRVVVSDGFCEFGQCGSHLRVLDVSDPAELGESGALELGDFVVDMLVAEGYAYVVTWESGLTIIDLADSANPQAVGTFNTPGSIENMALAGEYAYATGGGENGLLVLDMTDPTAPRPAAVLPMLFAGAVALADGYAYVPTWVEGLRVIDVTDPVNPVEVGALESSVLQGTADRVALGVTPPGSSGQTYAYLTVQEGGLMTLDVTEPADPRPVGAYAPPAGAIWGLSLADGTVYATGSTTEGDERSGILYVIDVADTNRPSQVAAIELPDHTSSNVTVAGDHAYVTLADCQYFICSGSLQLIDVSDPTQPQLVTALDVPGGAFALAITDDAETGRRYGYLTAGEEGVRVLDLSDPAQPHLVGQADTPGRARGIAVVGDLVYVGDGRGGFLVLRAVAARSAHGSTGFARR